jgi:hypothetical protein
MPYWKLSSEVHNYESWAVYVAWLETLGCTHKEADVGESVKLMYYVGLIATNVFHCFHVTASFGQ